MIKKNEVTGFYEQTQGLVSSGTESYSTAVNAYIQQNLDVAQTAMDRFDRSERNLSTLAFGCDEETYSELVEMVRRFRREILAKVGQCKKPNRVFQLGMQLFPLSDPYPPPQRRGRKRRIRGAEIQAAPANGSIADDGGMNSAMDVSCENAECQNACVSNDVAEAKECNHEE